APRAIADSAHRPGVQIRPPGAQVEHEEVVSQAVVLEEALRRAPARVLLRSLHQEPISSSSTSSSSAGSSASAGEGSGATGTGVTGAMGATGGTGEKPGRVA